jgi:hypothetical protein
VKIAKNLGLKQPAHQAPLCLDCHADYPPAEKRGEKFSMDDGIGCEGCHGGSERWLKDHDNEGRTHAQNIETGMYPTDDPVARAELCLSCHFGNKQKFVDHRLMGAGHPRQSFELALFTQIQPAHFARDDDYKARGKLSTSSAQTWAIGQAVAVRELAKALLDPDMSRDGVWPEFVLFDCHACHHPMSEARWRPRPSTGLPPGVARLDDASLLMLRHALVAVDSAAADALRGELRALHAATSLSRGDLDSAANKVIARAESAIAKLRAWKPDAASVKRIAVSLAKEGAAGEYTDYVGAEQATMAIQDLANELYELGALKGAPLKSVVAETKTLLRATKDPEKLDVAGVRASFGRVAGVLAQ